MANTLPSSSLQFSSPFRLASSVGKSQSPKPLLTFTTRAAEPESPNEPEKPPVPLKEPGSGGLKLEFGFSPYSERINGRIAMLGLAALILVDLATGKSVLNYHTPSIVLIQIYFVAAVSALYVKYEKERVSVWPPSSSSEE